MLNNIWGMLASLLARLLATIGSLADQWKSTSVQ